MALEGRTYEPVQPVRDKEVLERGKGFHVGHDEGHTVHRSHAIQAHLRARDGEHMVDEDERDVAAIDSNWAKGIEESLEQRRMSQTKVNKWNAPKEGLIYPMFSKEPFPTKTWSGLRPDLRRAMCKVER